MNKCCFCKNKVYTYAPTHLYVNTDENKQTYKIENKNLLTKVKIIKQCDENPIHKKCYHEWKKLKNNSIRCPECKGIQYNKCIPIKSIIKNEFVQKKTLKTLNIKTIEKACKYFDNQTDTNSKQILLERAKSKKIYEPLAKINKFMVKRGNLLTSMNSRIEKLLKVTYRSEEDVFLEKDMETFNSFEFISTMFNFVLSMVNVVFIPANVCKIISGKYHIVVNKKHIKNINGRIRELEIELLNGKTSNTILHKREIVCLKKLIPICQKQIHMEKSILKKISILSSILNGAGILLFIAIIATTYFLISIFPSIPDIAFAMQMVIMLMPWMLLTMVSVALYRKSIVTDWSFKLEKNSLKKVWKGNDRGINDAIATTNLNQPLNKGSAIPGKCIKTDKI